MRPQRQKTRFLTVSAMLAALGVVLLGLGAFVETLDLTTAALASILCVWAVIEMGGAYPWMIWAATALIGLLLLPQKSPAVFYLFIGCYPMVKEKLEKLPRLPCILLKLAVLHVMMVLAWLVMRLFFPAEAQLGFGWMLLALYVLGLAAFLIYDFALTRLITFYIRRLRDRLGLKKK